MAKLVALDPGPERTAFVFLGHDGKIVSSGIEPNESVKSMIFRGGNLTGPPWGVVLAIEMIACYGMPVGAEIFETCVWIGRFVEAWGGKYEKITRRDVKHHLCNSARATDANVRAALLDKWGGKAAAIGNKAAPGPLHGFAKDMWAALGVAATWWDKNMDSHLGRGTPTGKD